jgi:streptomycin 6-kinase
MTPPDLTLSRAVSKRIVHEGAAGQAWLAALPQTVASLAELWGVQLGVSLAGGSEALVLEALTADGRPAILKLPVPKLDPALDQMRVFKVTAGRGYAELYASDADTGALLLERLGESLGSQEPTADERHAILCRTLAEAWVSPAGEVFMTGAEKADSLCEAIEAWWRETGEACSRAAVDHALVCAERRRKAFDPDNAVLGHGDAHAWNTMAAPALGPGRYKFIDPDGLFIERAYDLGISMRGHGEELLAGDVHALAWERCRLLARLAGVDEEPIWEWGVVERVSSGLWCHRLGLHDMAADFLDVAEALAPR